MNSSSEMMELVNHAIAFLGVAASAASLLACVLYRRVSSAMIVLILGFAGDVVVMFLYLALGLANQYLWDYSYEHIDRWYTLAGFLGFATSALTAVGLFVVLADVARRQDRARTQDRDDDYGRRRPDYDYRDEPRWGRDPGGPDIRR